MSAAEKLQSAYASLRVIAGPHAGLKVDITLSEFTIGRGSDNDLVLENDQKISRQHLSIKLEGSAIKVTNISQKNFLLINGLREEEKTLTDSASILIGESAIELTSLLKKPEPKPILQPLAAVSNTNVTTPTAPAFIPTPTVTPITNSMPQPAIGNWNTPAPKVNNNFQTGYQTYKAPKAQNANNGKIIFYLIIFGLIAGGVWLFSGGKKGDGIDRGGYRKYTEIESDLQNAQNTIKDLTARQELYKNQSYQRAQENYIKGFRDFRQGNYARARDHFQIVLNLDPSNVLAQRYYNLSKIKFDELIQFHMIQGLNYREKKNYRLCKSSFQNVLIMIQNNPQHPKYKEANDFFTECNLALEGRY